MLKKTTTIKNSILFVFIIFINTNMTAQNDSIRSWRAGDHHIHSKYSAGYDTSSTPPTYNFDEQPYSILTNAEKAKYYGLDWMVATDHGGPNHSKINLENAYPELLKSRKKTPEVIQFHGMEFDAPSAHHNSLIIPHSNHEHTLLYEIESQFATRDIYPRQPERETEEHMLKALKYMKNAKTPPILISNHPSRGADSLFEYAHKEPREFRNWNDLAPNVAVGMEGAPGHQAGNLKPDGSLDEIDSRPYGNQTMGGYDQMTAYLGGFWDSMLGEGRRWWVTATSDSHNNWRDGGSDFWPGEYSKTYVYAKKSYNDILEGIRNGHIFITTGDLVSELEVLANFKKDSVNIGGTLTIEENSDIQITIKVRDPKTLNHHGDNPQVTRVDLIVGEITGKYSDLTKDFNPSTKVEKRYYTREMKKEGEYLIMNYTLKNVHHSMYIRVRGTNKTYELEPVKDHTGENPWNDLWFYSNPIFLEVK